MRSFWLRSFQLASDYLAVGISQSDFAPSAQDDGKSLRKYLAEIAKKKPAPLFGLMHYEKCRLMFQPLTLFGQRTQVKDVFTRYQADDIATAGEQRAS